MCSWSNLDFPLFWLICTIFLGSGGRALKPDCFHKSFGRQVLHKSGSDGCWYQDSLSLLLLLFGVFIYLFIFNFLLFTLLQLSSFFPTQPHPHLSSGHQQTYVCVYGLWIYIPWLIPSLFFILSPLPSNSCQSVSCVHASLSVLFISLFCSLDSTYK